MLIIAKLHNFHWKSTNVDQEAIIGTLRQAPSAGVEVGKILLTPTPTPAKSRVKWDNLSIEVS